MKITNNTAHTLIAFGFNTGIGYGEDVEILPGRTVDVNGPTSKWGESDILPGEITCQSVEDGSGYLVTLGYQLCLKDNKHGVTVRHYQDRPEDYVVRWRQNKS